MSSYFHSAAMTLLSKTLQTLLYKYLSDVDVEGVALPSLYDTEGHSGWGVRLSNVKLREGVKLMDLPGKMKKATTAAGHETKETSQATGETGLSEQSTKKETVDTSAAAASADNAAGAPTDPSPGEPVHTGSYSPAYIEDSSTTNTTTTSADKPNNPPRRSSSWFSWSYGRSRTKTEGENSVVTAPPDVSAAAVTSPPPPKSENSHIETPDPPTRGHGDPVDSASRRSTLSLESVASADDDGDRPLAPPPKRTEDEPPMRLRLGKDGTIGILDVRLVGKDLRVVVEDADLVIEAVTIKPLSNAKESTDEASTGKDKVKPVRNKQAVDPQTVGDRVLLENKIAKIFSMIPNLFLRDIRVKFVIRDEPVDEPDKPTQYESPRDTIVEMNIELLSVTDGQDFFAHVREEEEEEASTDEGRDFAEEDITPAVAPTINEDGQFTQNVYMTKRIRTGRGPEGGLVLKIVPGLRFLDSKVKHPQYARQIWYSSVDWCVLRCSGLDAHARIFIGNQEDLQISAAAEWYGDSEFDEYTVDSMLFGGVDYIPGPQPPLPPMPENEAIDTVSEDEGQLWTLPGATTYRVDANGIQSSFVHSTFHRVARGMRPIPCTRDHLPGEYCDHCWQGPPGAPLEHSYDMAAPLGGLVLNIMVRDPLEMNVDRPTLEIIGMLQDLFKKPPKGLHGESDTGKTGASVGGPVNEDEKNQMKQTVSSHSQSNLVTDASLMEGKRGSMDGVQATNGARKVPVHDDTDDETDAELQNYGDISAAFPSYMSPEKVSYMGGYVQEVIFRVHVMREHKYQESGHGFSFWQVHMKCLTFDQHTLSGNIHPFKDMRFDCGFLTMTTFKGVEHILVLSAGVRPRVVEFDDHTVETLMTRGEDCQRPPWPATSTVLLDIPPPLESLVYESRERHALQLRFISMNIGKRARSFVHGKLGTANINMPYAFIRELSTVIREARETIAPPLPKSQIPKAGNASPQSVDDQLMKFRLQIDGARVNLHPLIDTRLPMCSLHGDRSTITGLHFGTVLEKIQLAYGRPHKTTILEESRLSLDSLARLPEQLRMRILLCLDDLNPLARALGMKSEENSFLRCRSINKRIVRVANKKKKKRPSLRIDEEISRRQFLMQELTKLDDDELQDLYESHLRRMRRYSRNQNNS